MKTSITIKEYAKIRNNILRQTERTVESLNYLNELQRNDNLSIIGKLQMAEKLNTIKVRRDIIDTLDEAFDIPYSEVLQPLDMEN